MSLDQPPAWLIPIYKAAGRRYRVLWQILAAINAIETDYGVDLNVSPAGAEGWMQFMPATWARWGIAIGSNDKPDPTGKPNPYDPRDAIFSAARYLAASGAPTHVRQAIFAYNHARWYVDTVLWWAQAIRDRSLGRHIPTGAPLVAAGPGGGVNPFARATGLVPERVDMGVDFSMNPGSLILAPFRSAYLGTSRDWYKGQPYIAFKILSGPFVGRAYYLAEQIIRANLARGQTIPAGTPIAMYAGSGTGIEFGLANPANWAQTLAQAQGDAKSFPTRAGEIWRQILAALGVPG